jgi:hypothetical protein
MTCSYCGQTPTVDILPHKNGACLLIVLRERERNIATVRNYKAKLRQYRNEHAGHSFCEMLFREIEYEINAVAAGAEPKFITKCERVPTKKYVCHDKNCRGECVDGKPADGIKKCKHSCCKKEAAR